MGGGCSRRDLTTRRVPFSLHPIRCPGPLADDPRGAPRLTISPSFLVISWALAALTGADHEIDTLDLSMCARPYWAAPALALTEPLSLSFNLFPRLEGVPSDPTSLPSSSACKTEDRQACYAGLCCGVCDTVSYLFTRLSQALSL